MFSAAAQGMIQLKFAKGSVFPVTGEQGVFVQSFDRDATTKAARYYDMCRERERDVIIPNIPAVIVTLSTIVIDSLHMKEKHRTSFILGIDGLKTRDVRFLSTLDSQVFIRRHRGSTEKKVRNMQTLTWRIWSNSLI